MSDSVTPPTDVYIQAIFDKPGRNWSQEECKTICGWLLEKRKREYLLKLVLLQLGVEKTAEDAEDILGDFLATIHLVIDSYDPGKGRRFWNYLIICFERFCHRRCKAIREKYRHEEPLIKAIGTEENEFIEMEIVDSSPNSDPEKALAHKEFIKALNSCIKNMLPKYRNVFQLRDVDGLSMMEIAARLSISVPNAKVRLFRARKMLAKCLQKMGWEV
ncbi:RNA polymerase sigma factor [Candidatus Poribacteria bacterium]